MIEIKNKKAYFDYEILEEIEAGIVLTGTEIKSIRSGNANLKDSYAVIRNNEVFLLNMHISQYKEGNIFNHEEKRTRKLLLHKKEILKLRDKIILNGNRHDKGIGINWYDKIDSQKRELILLPKNELTKDDTLIFLAGTKKDNMEKAFNHIKIPNSTIKTKDNTISITSKNALQTLNALSNNTSFNLQINSVFRAKGKAISSKFVNKQIFNSNKGKDQQKINLNTQLFNELDL